MTFCGVIPCIFTGRGSVDFYCPAAKLVVEVDGGYHLEAAQAEYDLERTEYLNARGLLVLRFRNDEMENHQGGVCRTIQETVSKRIQEMAP